MKEKMWYKKNRQSVPERENFVMQKGQNAALIFKKVNNILAYTDQIRSKQEYESEMEIELGSQFSSDAINGQEIELGRESRLVSKTNRKLS